MLKNLVRTRGLARKAVSGGDAVDDDHGDVEESGFDGGGAAGDDGGVGGGEGVVGLVGDDAQRELSRCQPWRRCGEQCRCRRGRRRRRTGLRGFGVVDAQTHASRSTGRCWRSSPERLPGRTATSGSSGWKLVSGAERGAIERWLDVADERVADEFCGDAGVGVELFFEGENAEG